jgi:hypothetical protein
MNRFVRFSARLYPPAWRRRYGAEFDALLDDAGSGWRDGFDVLGGAIQMQILSWNFRNVTVVCGLLGLLAAAAWAWSLPNMYVSRALMRVQTVGPEDPQLVAAYIDRIWQQVVSRGSLSELIQRPSLDLYKGDRRRKPLEDVIENMNARDIYIDIQRKGPSTTVLAVSFRYPNSYVAQMVTSALVAKVIDGNQVAARYEQNRRTAASIYLLDPASLPANATAPNRWRIILVGLVLGILAGILILGARHWPLVAASGFAGLMLGWVVAVLMPQTYVSHAILQTTDPQQLPGLTARILSDEFLETVIEQQNLYPGLRASRPMAEIVRSMRERDLRIEAIGQAAHDHPTAIRISYQYSDRFKAQTVVAKIIVNALPRAANLPVDLVDAASLPETPVAPNRPVAAAVGMAFGALGGWAVYWIRRRRHPAMAAA